MQDFKGVFELVLTKLCRLLIRSSNLREGKRKKMLALGPGARTITPQIPQAPIARSCHITARIVGDRRVEFAYVVTPKGFSYHDQGRSIVR